MAIAYLFVVLWANFAPDGDHWTAFIIGLFVLLVLNLRHKKEVT